MLVRGFPTFCANLMEEASVEKDTGRRFMVQMQDRENFTMAPDEMPPSFPPATPARSASVGVAENNVLPPESQNGESAHDTSAAGAVSGENADAAEAAQDSAPVNDINRLQENAQLLKQNKIKSFFGSVFEFMIVIAAALLVAVLLKTFIIQPFEIPSSSMANTLIPNDRIVVNKLADTEDELQRGDIVVFVDPGNWLAGVPQPEVTGVRKAFTKVGEAIGLIPQNAGTHLVKRLIGKPGDHLVCCSAAGNLLVNGTEVKETYLIDGAISSLQPFDVTVPAGHLWVMGDNRPGSKDSRYHQEATGFGFVPIENVEGRAWLRVYPFSRFGTLKDESQVFAKVPAAPVTAKE